MASREIDRMVTPNTIELAEDGRETMNKQVIFHDKFYTEYTFDPAAKPGRMEAIMRELSDFRVLTPEPATDDDVLLIHSENHLLRVKNDRDGVYPIALLAAGGAIF